MFGKTHSESSKYIISKPGDFNPMFGRTHSEVTKQLMSIKKSIIPLGLYDENNNFSPFLAFGWSPKEEKYSNQVELANKFGVHKTTISKYIKTGKLFKNKFYIRKINN